MGTHNETQLVGNIEGCVNGASNRVTPKDEGNIVKPGLSQYPCHLPTIIIINGVVLVNKIELCNGLV